MTYYAIPDIHGNFEGLKEAVELIMNEFVPKSDTLIFLGDYIDRGEQSLEVVQYLKKLQEEMPEGAVVCLLGNHEEMFLNWLKYPLTGYDFIANDYKLRTVKSFTGDYFALSDLGLSSAYEIIDRNTGEDKTYPIAKYINESHSELIQWMQQLPRYFDRTKEDNVLFIHAGIEENILGGDWKQYTTKQQMVWKYPISYGTNPYHFSVVAGHVMTDELWQFTDEPCYDIYVTGNHYYLDGASPRNERLNILKIKDSVYSDFRTGVVLSD